MQYNQHRGVLIALTGISGSGKSSAAKELQYHYGFDVTSFSQPIRDMAVRITPDGMVDKKRDRKLLQFIGDYWRGINPDYFVNLWTHAVEERLNEGQNVVVDDLRYHTATEERPWADNEYQAIERLGGLFVKVDVLRPVDDAEFRQHATEQPIDANDPRLAYVIGGGGAATETYVNAMMTHFKTLNRLDSLL